MNFLTHFALLASIEHWRRNAADPKSMTHGPEECALCRRFNSFVSAEASFNCSRYGETCPVAKASGATGCAETPYDILDCGHLSKEEEAFEVQQELAFLESLLPEAEKTFDLTPYAEIYDDD